jgi:hypothetical protein
MPHEREEMSAAHRKIDVFRRRRQKLPLHPAELKLVAILCVHLCFLPWALGTMHVWSQLVSLALGIMGFGLALSPRFARGESRGISPVSKLIRFPIFWLGILLLSYVTIQALNPWMRYTHNDTSWWLTPVNNVSWLPAGIEAPYKASNQYRQLVVYSSALLSSCAIWIGVTRRSSCRILFAVISGNAFVITAVIVFQRFTGYTGLPWPMTFFTDRAGLTASFVYHNHAGEYLGLMTLTAIALATWGYDQGLRTMKKSTPTAALALVAIFLVVGVLFTLSRGATIILGGLIAAYGGWIYLRCRLRPSGSGSDTRVTVVVAILFGAFVFVIGENIDFSAIGKRFDGLIQAPLSDYPVVSRLEARKAGFSLLLDHGLRGVGAGGFRYVFPLYAQRFPDIYQGGRLFWEHLHDDLLEVPIELGLFGVMTLAAMAGYWATVIFRSRFVWYASATPGLFGCLGTFLHAAFDFPFQCPAILITWCILLTITCRCLVLEMERRG